MTLTRYRNLLDLIDCLHGVFSENTPWDDVIKLALDTMTIASLAAVVARQPDTAPIPEEVRTYLGFIGGRNGERNCAILRQLREAACCLNQAGIVPIVVKGLAILVARRKANTLSDRMLVDLDLLVPPAGMTPAIEALETIGYRIIVAGGYGTWPGDPNYHLPTVLGRDQDAATIDLQCRPRGPSSFADLDTIYDNSVPVNVDDGRVLLPSPAVQTALLLLHDQFQDADYFRGLVDIRHLIDIEQITDGARCVDFSSLRALFRAGYERNAVDAQLLTAQKLLGTEFDWTPRPSRLARAQWLRRRIQMDRPGLRSVLTVLSLLSELGQYSAWDRYGGAAYASRSKETKRRLRELRRLFQPPAFGKV